MLSWSITATPQLSGTGCGFPVMVATKAADSSQKEKMPASRVVCGMTKLEVEAMVRIQSMFELEAITYVAGLFA